MLFYVKKSRGHAPQFSLALMGAKGGRSCVCRSLTPDFPSRVEWLARTCGRRIERSRQVYWLPTSVLCRTKNFITILKN
ncbi:hypothetical protein KL86DES1_10646 [uncultured Desulfovibrio sp.]|uniref:Uncharacterized protein n=1 Tax=uncultured Desulfovibrio sp. TaxID=167968 RepID=A0A212KZU6_9BACT|nr:hypothetical protein KL86DES1_10646 [uncultured Desulfovibrio sp.]VZH32519.1 conserved protein of unknown function [Desulfovibrio sp. 86]